MQKIGLTLIWMVLISFSCQTERRELSKTEILVSFAKTYGYLKYFHPSDQAAELDWDKFAIYACQQIEAGDVLQTSLETLYSPFIIDFSIKPTRGNPTPDAAKFSWPDTNQLIYWQHLGNGENRVGAYYKSLRVNRPAYVLPDSPNDFGGVRYELDMDQLRGKKLHLEALLRPHADYIGMGSLRLHLKAPDQPWIRYHSTDQVSERDQWNLHQLDVEVPKDIERAIIYLQTIGMMGTIDFDGVNLSVTNAERAQNLVIKNAGFDQRETFERDWKPRGPNQDFNIKTEKNNNYLSISRTKGMLQNIPPLFPKNSLKTPSIHKDIGSGLSLFFPLIITKAAQDEFTNEQATAWNILREQLASITDLGLEKEEVRLANLIKAWNVFQHFYPYFDLFEIDWEMQLRQAINDNESDENIADHIQTLKKMLAPLQDSHLGIYRQTDDYFPPIKLGAMEGQVVITEVLDTSISLKVGAVLKQINGQKMKDYWQANYVKAQGATFPRKTLKTIEEILTGQENSTLEVEVKDAKDAVHLKRSLSEADFGAILTTLEHAPFQEIEPGIQYINLSDVSWAFLQEQMAILEKAKGLIFDLRGYPSWQTMEIVGHFTKDTLSQLQPYTPEVLYPDQEHRTWQPLAVKEMYPKKPLLRAEKVFLTDARAISYSETFLNLVKHYKLATIIGEQTAGSTGNVNMLYLIGGISIPWTGMKVLDQNGQPFQGTGITPDIPVDKTISAIVSREDEYLKAALELLKKTQ